MRLALFVGIGCAWLSACLNGMRKSVHRRTRSKPRAATNDWSLFGSSGQRKYLNGAERRRFLQAAMRAAPEVRTLCLTLTYIGCRLTEALNLTSDDIEIEEGLILVRSLKKRGKLVMRQVPAPPSLLNELSCIHRLTATGSDPRKRLWSWGRTRAWQLVKAVMNDAHIRFLPASPKGLRHGFGVHAILSGVPLTLVQKWLGHADISTTAIYLDVLGPEERRIAARMWLGLTPDC